MWIDLLRICSSGDHKNAQAKAVGFGGFFSCQYGNPFALPPDTNAKEYLPENLPRTCPTGYSQYLMTHVHYCNIYACLEDNFGLPRSPLKFPEDPSDIRKSDEENASSSDLQIKGAKGTILSRNIEGKWEFSSDSTCQSKDRYNHKKKTVKKA